MKWVRNIVDKKKIILLIIIGIFIGLMTDMNSRLSDLYRLSTKRDQMQTEVYQIEETRASLMKQYAYATSEAAVEEWARVYNRLSQPGDQVIIPLPTGEVVQTPIVINTPTFHQVENWEIWKALFFD